MPTVSEFYGIKIRMRYNEKHGPHFHASYGEFVAQISIADGSIMHGYLPARAAQLVLEWLNLHRAELTDNWNRMHHGQTPQKIQPLR